MMKSLSILVLLLATPPIRVIAEGCPCNNIQTPAVPTPADASILSASCSGLLIGWHGLPGMDYVVRVSYLNPLTGQCTESGAITSVLDAQGKLLYAAGFTRE